ncbi:DUF6441 family protein [Stakelama tenebrarum]|uniref:Uncharacterized protein n=1 Tax=Stakelama tenebrarum TaxID=2711215 RepID=A0A6G6Y5A7_9SPHN|nr:DUF6441 family protein [Sphingosinithalassobacter tenebrarum]QIG79987.1 hypothetical protein G5C33_09500 [Sphingosinithalassobacter tenebrarum]
MRTRVIPPTPRRHEKALVAALKRAHMLGMRATIKGAQEEFRDDVLAAGLGHRLAKTVRRDVYPETGSSMSPAGVVYAAPGKPGSRSAAAILGHYQRGTSITPALGNWLLIPTKEVPKRGGRGWRSPMTAQEVEAMFGRRLQWVKQPNGNYHLFLRRRRGKKVKSLLMFVAVRDVPGNKRLDFDAIWRNWGARLPGNIAAFIEYDE